MIDILPSDEQTEMVGAISAAVEKSDLVALSRSPWAFFADLGCIGMALDESVGGSGFTIADEALVHRELGRRLASPNVLAAALAARLAASSGDADLAGRIVSGAQPVAFASALSGGVLGGRLGGQFHLLSAAEEALILFVSQAGCVLAKAGDFGARAPAASIDDDLELVRVTAAEVPAIHGTGQDDPSLWRIANLLMAAEMAGIAEITQEKAVAYAKIREQFGKPIGAFQAVAHHCATMALRTDAALSQVYFAAIAVRDEAPDAAFQVAAACSVAMDAALQNATTSIQVHGGMGYAAQGGLQGYLKRAVLLRHLAGGERAQEIAVFEADRAG
jgi:alkylation response protein AidB-like acyl-CoA dehydrogenase